MDLRYAMHMAYIHKMAFDVGSVPYSDIQLYIYTVFHKKRPPT